MLGIKSTKYEESSIVLFFYNYAQTKKHKKFFAQKNKSKWKTSKLVFHENEPIQKILWPMLGKLKLVLHENQSIQKILNPVLGKLKPRKNQSKLGIQINYFCLSASLRLSSL